ncbi:MAG TPA: N-formylglutamate amidohydrolase [Patescibacteria group bacterium]|nr:N-formylglutamate amidohydrolase [Patescibacteria group bacterium]
MRAARSVRVLRPTSLSPIVLTCEHASRALPRGMTPRGPAERAVLASHWGWDIGAWDLTRALSRRLDASAVGGGWSRLVVDLNRRIGDPTLIRHETEGVALSWNARVTPAEVERRALLFHVPYHAAINLMVIRRVARGVRPILLAVHSFTPLYDGRHRDFDVGVLFDRCRSGAIRLAEGLKKEGLRVRYNEPYSGLAGMMYAIHRHGTHHGLPCLELEMSQDLFARPGAAARLAAAVARALEPLVAAAAAGRSGIGPASTSRRRR